MTTDQPASTRRGTATSSFGVGKREAHDSSAFYARFRPPQLSDDESVNQPAAVEMYPSSVCVHGSSVDTGLPDNSVALVVTSPPYFVGKDYELALDEGDVPETYLEFLDLLRAVFAECERVLEPGGRIAVNVANLGRRPYRSLSADVISILQDDLGLLLRGEVIWQKGKSSSGSCAWGSFAKAANPVLRDVTERVIIASKGRFARAIKAPEREARGLPFRSTLSNDEFVDVTRDVWEIDAESATRVGHPAPFPIELPHRLIELYSYEGDVILDPFGGAGTTMVAAARTGRVGIGFDTDPDYVELANNRLADDAVAMAESDGADGAGGDARRDYDDRYDDAVSASAKMLDLVQNRLEAEGYELATKGGKFTAQGIEFPLVATDPDGERFYVDVVGGFTITKPGLERTDELWRAIGRFHVLRTIEPEAEVLLITSKLPRPTTPGAKALNAAIAAGGLRVQELDPT